MRERLHWISIALLILMYSGVFGLTTLLPIGQNIASGIALAGTVILLLPHFNAVRDVVWQSRLLLIFLCFVGLSVFWSINREESLTQSVILLGASGLGFYIASQYSIADQIRFYVRLLIATTITSVLVALILPQVGIHQDPFHFGRWRGITLHKNILGEWMSLTAMLLLVLPDSLIRLPKWFRYSMAVLSIALLFLTVSVTSIVSFALILVLYPVIVILRQDFRLKVAIVLYFLAGVIITSVVISLNFSELLVQIGRTPTLTERSIIWPVIISRITESPLLGYGYMSFFIPESYWLGTGFEDLIWRPAHAHNAWLDLMMDFGIVGLGLFLLIIWRGLQRCYQMYVHYQRTEILIIVLLILNILTRSMTETLAIRRQDIIWIMLISLLARLYLDSQERPPIGDRARTTDSESLLG